MSNLSKAQNCKHDNIQGDWLTRNEMEVVFGSKKAKDGMGCMIEVNSHIKLYYNLL